MDFLDRLRGRDSHIVAPTAEQPTVVQIDATALSRVFSAPMWLRDLGLLSWFLVGVGLALVGAVWLIGLTSTITEPVVVGAILATVAGPLVSRMKRRGIPRVAGAALVLLALLALGAIIALLVFGGIYENSAEIKQSLSTAVDKVERWVNDAGAGGRQVRRATLRAERPRRASPCSRVSSPGSKASRHSSSSSRSRSSAPSSC